MGNKLILEFLNTDVNNDGTYELPQFGTIRPNGDFKSGFTAEQTKFNKDWDWLMSVVGKIEATKDEENNGNYYVEIYTSSCIIFSNGDYVNEIVSTSADTKIEAVYQAVVEFINNYNTQE
jgi:hypothetical protein